MLSIDGQHIEHYWDLKQVRSVRDFGHGHINDTYLVRTDDQRHILQRVNKKVFNTPKLVSNYELLTRQVASYQEKTGAKLTPDIIKTKRGVHHYIDDENYAWRLAEFIPDAASYDISPDPKISYEAAMAMGKYQLFLNTIEPKQPCDTIRGFHDLPGRMKTFQATLESCDTDLLASAASEVQKITSYTFIGDEFHAARAVLPIRITHNDTKLNNILFKGSQCYVIDLDTVMRGFIMYDYGDMVRTFCSPVTEDEMDEAKTKLRIDHFEALTKGYLEVLRSELAPAEKQTLFVGALCIIYEQATRFLNDYLSGSVYYKTSYPKHNLIRTRTQLKLLDELIMQRAPLEEIIARYI